MLNAWFNNFARFCTYVTIVIITTISCFGVINGDTPAASATIANRWSSINLPKQGEAGGWVLSPGSDIRYLTAAPDGTFYAYGQGTTHTLLKSIDGGRKWNSIIKTTDNITGIAVSATDPDLVYYSTNAQICRSADAGKSFMLLPAVPGAGTGNVTINSIAASNSVLVAGTSDKDDGHYGGVFLLDESIGIPSWEDTGIGDYDVFTVALPPDFYLYRQIVAVVTDETDTFVLNKIAGSGWNVITGPAKLSRDNTGFPVRVAESAGIVFPPDYDTGRMDGSDSAFYVCISTGAGSGDVYKIVCRDTPSHSEAIDLNAGLIYGISNMDFTSLAVIKENSSTTLIAGAKDARIFISKDGGINWVKNLKAPAGNTDPHVLLPAGFSTDRVMYTATSGNSSGVSVSRDLGSTWNQISLIDGIVNGLVDLAVSPHYHQDHTLFLVTFGAAPDSHSLWRTQDGGLNWERILSGDSPGVDVISLIGLPPQYGDDGNTLYVSGESGARPVIWLSEDNGQSFRVRYNVEPSTGAQFTVDDWVIIDNGTLFVASHDIAQAFIVKSVNKGFSYTAGAPAGISNICSLALSPDFPRDGTIAAGSTNGEIYLSNDGGASFILLPSATDTGTLSGNIDIAFDPDFKTNHYIYAAGNTVDTSVFRFTVGESEEWQRIDVTLPAGATISSLLVSGNGVLYAVNSCAGGGMERCLEPHTARPVFETVTRGVTDTAALYRVCGSGSRLWALDIANGKLMTYEDTLSAPVIPESPIDGSSGIGDLVDHAVKNVTMDWQPLEGAEGYEWQCAVNGDFTNIPTDLQGTSGGSYIRLPTLEPSAMYAWRVRVNAPSLSLWSVKQSFTTSLDTRAVELKPESPAAGASGVSIQPVFQWTAVAGVSSYELQVAGDTSFADPVIDKFKDSALSSNAWECDINLEPETTYYWRVRAISGGSHSYWSATGVFTTVSDPAVIEEPVEIQPEVRLLGRQDTQMNISQPYNTPVYPPAAETTTVPISIPAPASEAGVNALSGIPAWLLYFIGGLLVIVMLALLIILAVVLKIKRF